MSLVIEAPRQTKLIDGAAHQLFAKAGTSFFDPHGEHHHENVKKIGDALAVKAGCNLMQRLAIWAGLGLHDVEREPSQNAASAARDEKRSSKIVRRLLDDFNVFGEIETTEEVRQDVENAVAHHGESPWKDAQSQSEKEKSFRVLAREITFIPDKLEQMDAISVFIRRSRFVPGERLSKGDLKDFGFSFEDPDDRLRVFVFESVIRLTHVTPESIYPEHLKDIFKPLFAKQRELVLAVARAAGFDSIESIAKAIVETNNIDPQSEAFSKNLLQARKVVYQKDIREYAKLIEERGGLIDKALEDVSDDMQLSAKDGVLYLSQTWKRDDLDFVIDEWEPKGEYGKTLREEAKKYISGEWADQIAEQILAKAA